MSNSYTNIIEEKQRSWRKDHPYDFVAHPIKMTDGTLNLFRWVCIFPGPYNTIWSKGYYKLNIKFPNDRKGHMKLTFEPPIFHPNVNGQTGRVRISLAKLWPRISIKQILCAVQDYLANPNIYASENSEATYLYTLNREEYKERVSKDIGENHRLSLKIFQ